MFSEERLALSVQTDVWSDGWNYSSIEVSFRVVNIKGSVSNLPVKIFK